MNWTGREIEVIKGQLWVSSENDYYGIALKFYLHIELMVNCAP